MEDTHYKNLEQLQYTESLCNRPLVFYHAVEESYPEIEIHIKRDFKPSFVKELLEPVIRNASFDKGMIEIEPYDKGERGYNELVLRLDLKLFDNPKILELVSIVKDIVKPYASISDVEYIH